MDDLRPGLIATTAIQMVSVNAFGTCHGEIPVSGSGASRTKLHIEVFKKGVFWVNVNLAESF